MGEAGPEAIMPLARDSQGRLGVRASGVSPVINQTINVNVSGGGVSDMVEQQRLAREIGRLTRAGVIAAIQEQQRAGGLLRPSPQMV
jgi:phage-related minor tail protein